MAVLPPLVALQGASITFGGRPLFSGVDISLGRGERLCLIGRNGSGKSTMLKALAGLIGLDAGERFLQPGTRVGYLPQEPDFSGFPTVHDYVAAGLVADDHSETHRVDAVLDRLSLPGGRATANLSGGEGRRAALARTLVGDPDVLLLDEPTNHLDLPTIEWLENELVAYRGGLLLISHDRAFLTRLARRTVWLDRGTLRDSNKSFADFENWQTEVFASEEQAAHKLDRKLAAETQWMAEGISARRTRNMGRVRALQQLRRDRAERVRGGAQVRMAVSESDSGGRLVIEAKHITKSFEPKSFEPKSFETAADPETGSTTDGRRIIVSDFSTRILRGDRVGLIGPNGAGKTTLLRMLTGDLAPDGGQVRLGVNLQMIYYDQKREQLDPEATIRQVLCPYGGDSVSVGGQTRHVASYMRDFLFDSRMIDQPTKAMSGGERNRLLLARLFARPSNLIILDEPTNDLDMDTLDLLEEVLDDYQGTLLLVSHDRDFLDRLVTSVIAVEGGGEVTEYPGGYSDYQVQRRGAAVPGEAAPRPRAAPAPAAAPARAPRKLSYKDQRELEALPGQMDKLAAEIRHLEGELADPALFSRDATRFHRTTETLQQRQVELAGAEERWLTLETLRESLEAGTP
ncbi:MAG: ATP-binding cassette domain-containing protein [Azospirillaceae bacterium]|nr:ATP-binding cassette domain-containing protein [Azospirillaceae bacterium]